MRIWWKLAILFQKKKETHVHNFACYFAVIRFDSTCYGLCDLTQWLTWGPQNLWGTPFFFETLSLGVCKVSYYGDPAKTLASGTEAVKHKVLCRAVCVCSWGSGPRPASRHCGPLQAPVVNAIFAEEYPCWSSKIIFNILALEHNLLVKSVWRKWEVRIKHFALYQSNMFFPKIKHLCDWSYSLN